MEKNVGRDVSVMWFRRDLRTADNPALQAAADAGSVVPVYILDNRDPDLPPSGSASRVWLQKSLESLNKQLGGTLQLLKGDAERILHELCTKTSARRVFWNRCYTPWRVSADAVLKKKLLSLNIVAKSFNGSLLWEPWQVKKPDGAPYRIFTPFYKKGCLGAGAPRAPVRTVENLPLATCSDNANPIMYHEIVTGNAWEYQLAAHWQIGEKHAQNALMRFLDTYLAHYHNGRDFPAQPYVSRLSPHLAFGELSPHQVWHALDHLADDENVRRFRSELVWREFSYHLLYHFPHIGDSNFNEKYDRFSWGRNRDLLTRWQRGQTGIPIVDAGMRELWQTGYMHNRVRMIVASFLTKNLLLDWRWGAAWFEYCLFDADRANNRASWQWVAGCGADAAPYFRIFNPVLQARKFDPAGAYIRKYVPELEKVPDRFVFWPHDAPADMLRTADAGTGVSYPAPIVDLQISRQRALDAFRALKTAG